MKRLIAILTVTVLLASCGNKMTLMKRHYTKGFYVEGTKAAQTPKTLATVKPVKLEAMAAKKTSVSTEIETPSLHASITNGEDFIVTKQTVQKKNNEAQREYSAAKKHLFFNRHISAHQNVLGESKAGGSSDANLIILVILSLFPFINLIAIYLHDGKKVTTNFWLDLLLDCLFLFPGVIFALLVVLDVVNLA